MTSPRRIWPRNPYQYGSPVSAGHFTDRERDLERLITSMLNGQNLILIAPRRYGKSSLLNRAVNDVREAGGATGKVNLIKCSSSRDVAEELMKGVINGPMGWFQGRTTEMLQRLGRIRLTPEFRFDPHTGMVEGVRLSAAAAEVDWRRTIGEVVRSLRDLARAHPERPVSLIMDEFQKVQQIEDSLPDVFKDLVDELEGVALVFAGSRQHLMERMADPHGPLYDVGLKVSLPRISRDDFAGYLRARAAEAGKSMSEAVAWRIFEVANGIPNDVQLIAFWAFHWARGPAIQLEHVELALRDAIGDQRAGFQSTFDELAPSQQKLLKLVAAGAGRHLSSARVLQELEVSSTNAMRKARQALERADLIEGDGDDWILKSGLLRQWLIGSYD